MKKALIVPMILTVTIGGCVRPVNRNNRQPNERRGDRRPAPPVDQRGLDRRPNAY